MNSTRYPNVLVLLNGQSLPSIVDIEITSNSHFAANRFRVRAAIDKTRYDTWASGSLVVEIRVAVSGSWGSLIYGDVDRLDFDVGRGEVCIDGRDLTSRFIEARTGESFENHTASEIATVLALRRSLVPAITPSSIIIGRSYKNDRSRTTLVQHARWTTEWDLLVQLADSLGFDIWVDNQTLNFTPPNQRPNSLSLAPNDCLSINLHRLINLESGLNVTVKSWDCRGQRSVVQTATTASGFGPLKDYLIVRPNLSDDDAQMVAQRLLSQMCQHKRTVSIEMPGDTTTRPRDLLRLTDTNTDFDGVWTITDLHRRISVEHGFTQTIEARAPAWTIF